MNKLRIGHHRTPSDLKRLNLTDSTLCSFCSAPIGDIEHLIFKCRQFYIQRIFLARELSDFDNVNLNNDSRLLKDYLKN